MDHPFLIALVAAFSALIGSLIPTLFNYWNNNKQRNFEVKKIILEKQKDVYLELLLAMQDLVNYEKNHEYFFRLQKSGLQVAIYGDEKASQAFHDYYYDLIRSSLGGRDKLSADEHRQHQANILNSMRSGLGLGKIAKFEIVAFRPKEAQQAVSRDVRTSSDKVDTST